MTDPAPIPWKRFLKPYYIIHSLYFLSYPLFLRGLIPSDNAYFQIDSLGASQEVQLFLFFLVFLAIRQITRSSTADQFLSTMFAYTHLVFLMAGFLSRQYAFLTIVGIGSLIMFSFVQRPSGWEIASFLYPNLPSIEIDGEPHTFGLDSRNDVIAIRSASMAVPNPKDPVRPFPHGTWLLYVFSSPFAEADVSYPVFAKLAQQFVGDNRIQFARLDVDRFKGWLTRWGIKDDTLSEYIPSIIALREGRLIAQYPDPDRPKNQRNVVFRENRLQTYFSSVWSQLDSAPREFTAVVKNTGGKGAATTKEPAPKENIILVG